MELIAIIAFAIAALIAWYWLVGFIVRISTRVVAGFVPSYGRALGVTIAGGFFGSLLGRLIAKFGGPALDVDPWFLLLIGSCLGHAVVFGTLMKHPETGPIGFGKGLLLAILPAAVLMVVILGAAFFLPLPGGKGNAFLERFRSRLEWSAFVKAEGTEKPVIKTNVSAVTVESSQREAMRLYPALGVAGSAFNKEFLKRHRLYQQEQPEYFQDPTWPLLLAEETKNVLLPTQVPGDGRVNVRH